MSDQLFRFSVLRAPEEAASLTPIVVDRPREPVSDAYVAVVEDVADWIRRRDADATIDGLSQALSIAPGDLDRDAAAETANWFTNQFRQAFLRASEAPDRQPRSELNTASDHLTASVVLSEVAWDLDPTTTIDEWLAKHPIHLGPSLAPQPTWKPKQGLSRTPAIADHYVVRESLAGYRMGEIEDIKNYLLGEKKKHTLLHRTVDEEEVVSETELEVTRVEEASTQQRSNMKAAAESEANASTGFDARVRTDGQYGPTKVSTDTGFQFSSSTKESAQTASEFSSEVLARSVETVRSRELKRVTRRHRSEIEENRAHSVDNVAGAGHLVGIYRWVDSVWDARTYLIGKRLILEFLVPEPARALRLSQAVPKPPPVPAPTPPQADLFDKLDDALAAKYAVQYGIDGITPSPLPFQVIGVPFGSADFKDNEGPHVSSVTVKDLKVPTGYVGKTVFVAVTSMQRIESDEMNVVVDIPGGKPAEFLDGSGIPNPNQFGGGPGMVGRSNSQLKTLLLRSVSDFGPGATIPLTIYLEDSRGASGYAEVHCHRSDEALNGWKLDTVQKIAAAYRARQAEWESARTAESFEEEPDRAPLDLDALCRHACIGSLLGSWPGTGGRFDPAGWPRPGALGGATGRLVEFLEQAIEWSNLQYVAYPYYWADGGTWMTLLGVEDPQPKVREFLRSGAVRIVVPVRPDLTRSMLFYLETGIPWFGGPAPSAGEDGYLAIAVEIEEQRTGVAGDGELVSEFRYSLPTSLTILQADGVLPAPP